MYGSFRTSRSGLHVIKLAPEKAVWSLFLRGKFMFRKRCVGLTVEESVFWVFPFLGSGLWDSSVGLMGRGLGFRIGFVQGRAGPRCSQIVRSQPEAVEPSANGFSGDLRLCHRANWHM